MKLGMCCDIARADALARAGIEYIEQTVADILSWSSAQLRENLRFLSDAGVRMISCNCLVSGFSLFDPDGLAKSRDYLGAVLPRLGEAGVEKAVFGSGGFRRVPDGVPPQEARQRLLEFLALLSDMSRPYGLEIVIEPLNAQRACNIITTAEEGAGYVREVARDNVRLLIDFRHFVMMGELLGTIAGYRGILTHTHIAHPCTFFVPEVGDGCDYAGFVRALEGIGYDGLIVCEPTVRDLTSDLRHFVEAMRQAGVS